MAKESTYKLEHAIPVPLSFFVRSRTTRSHRELLLLSLVRQWSYEHRLVRMSAPTQGRCSTLQVSIVVALLVVCVITRTRDRRIPYIVYEAESTKMLRDRAVLDARRREPGCHHHDEERRPAIVGPMRPDDKTESVKRPECTTEGIGPSLCGRCRPCLLHQG